MAIVQVREALLVKLLLAICLKLKGLIMKNKTCGECKYLYIPDWTICLLDGSHIVWDRKACEKFKEKEQEAKDE
jgi:hypothetical protein